MKTRSPLSAAAGRWLASLLLLLLLRPAFGVPDITVSISGNSIPDGGSFRFDSIGVGGQLTADMTISNSGSTPLILLNISKTEPNSNDFSHGTPSVFFLSAGQSTSVPLYFEPFFTGLRTANFSIESNDPDENPFNITAFGVALPAPRISVTAAGQWLTDGVSTVNFGNTEVGGARQRNFFVRNDGTANLSVTDASVGGAGFTLQSFTAGVVAPGQSMSFIVRFEPLSESDLTGSLSISSNDPGPNPFNITLRGTGIVPVFRLEHPPGTPFDEQTTVALNAPPGVAVQRMFRVHNLYTFGQHTGLLVSLEGAGAASFAVVTPLPAVMGSGASADFIISYTPSSPGTTSAALRITSDFTGASPIIIQLTGTGVVLDPAGDADRDGVKNLLEIATGQDPLSPGPQPGVLVKNGDDLQLTFFRSVGAQADTTLSVEWADDAAGPWTTLDTSSAFLLTDNGIIQELHYTMPAGSGQRFLRLRATKF